MFLVLLPSGIILPVCKTPSIFTSPPIYALRATPIPPNVVIDPSSNAVDCVVLLTIILL